MKRRILSIITALALCLSLCPTWAFATEADPSLCKHHPEHTEDCGYAAPTEGHGCGHQHTAECYTKGVLPDADGGDYYEIGADTENLLDCQHSHDSDCGYVQADPGAPCGYVCHICPIEALIAALPEQVTEDNADDVRARLDHILDLYRELTEAEQGQLDLSRVTELQGALDAANDPDMIEGEVPVAYQEASWNDSEVTYTDKTADSCTPVADSTEAVTWNAGWYVVNSTVTITEPITVNGAVNLILADGCTLNAEKGIVVPSDASLTIYAQSDGTGTLNTTGTVDSDKNASAGIGGSTSSLDSGAITIHGGVINATGGTTNPKNGYGGAGIGGGSPMSGNGGSSGAITIYGGTVTANSGAGSFTGAGIGGGGGDAGGAGSNITIYGGNVTAEAHGTSLSGSGAGIGGGFGSNGGGAGSNIQIHGGTVHATGGDKGAGIGGGGTGNGSTSGSGTITISGGNVTAVGGNYAAGIGGGGGYKFEYSGTVTSNVSGGIGSVTISGGIVDAKGGAGNSSGNYAGDPIGNGGNAGDTAATVNKTTGIVFENGAGTVYGDVTLDGSYTVPAAYTLNIPAGASLSGSGTLSGGGTFTTEILTADMISVPTNLYYDGKDRTEYLTTELSGELTKGVTICGQTFTVGGWTLAVAKTDDLHYTATYTNNNDNTNTFTKTITLQKSGTDLSEGKVLTYNGETQTDTFTAGDTIKVVATPTPTEAAPTNSDMFAASFTPPTTGQMVVFVNNTQVSEPAGAGEDGSYTMTVSAADVLLAANGPKTGITLTAKFVENDNMADGTGTATVNITAVAVAEKDGKVIGYYGESNLDDAFTNDSATVTLLANVERTTALIIKVSCTLDLNGKTIHSTGQYESALGISSGATVTVRGDGTVTSEHGNGLSVGGTATLEGGNFISGAADYGGVNVRGKLIVTGKNVVMRNTGNGNGLSVNSGTGATAQLSAGTYGGGTAAIEIYEGTGTLAGLLNQEGASRVAYYKDNTTLVTEGMDGKELTGGSYTVKACTHIFGSSPTCLACGEQAVARVTIGDAVTHYGDLPSAWAAVQGQTAGLYLLKSVDAAGVGNYGYLDLRSGSVTLGMADGVVLSGSNNSVIKLTGGELTLNSGTIQNDNDNGAGLIVQGGTLRVHGGTVEGRSGIHVFYGQIEITGGTITGTNQHGTGFSISAGTVKISGGQFSGSQYAVYNRDGTLADLLAEDYAFKKDGNWVTNTSGDSLTGTVTVEPAPVKITAQPVNTSQRYGDMDALSIETSPGQDESVTYQWYVVKASGAEAVSGEIAPVFSPSQNQRLDVGSYQYFCEVTKDGYTQRSNTVTFTVTPRQVTPSITGTADKTYDGTKDAPDGLSITLDGVVNGDDVTATASYAYDDANAGEDKTITASGITLEGGSKDNYTLSITTATTTGTITKATVSITWDSTTQTVTYTGKTAEITAPTVTAEGGVAVSVTPTYSYHQEGGEAGYRDGLPTNAGTYSIIASIEESGNLTAARADMMLTINKASLSIDSAAVASKPYDGTDTATVSGVTFTGLVNGETLALDTDYTATGTFADANAGEDKSVTVTVTLADTAKANNYTLASTSVNTTGTITKADPVVTDVSVSSPDPIYESVSLNNITLTHGADDTAGTVALDAGQTLTVGTKGYAWTFTPTDTDNYNTATGTISLTVAVDALQSIAVTTPPSKTAYTYGENFDKAGMVITATYASGATKVVTGEVQISPAELTVTTTELTITYQGKTVTQAITVNPKTVSAPTIELSPSSFVYDGAEKKPAVTVKDGEKMIPADEYTVEYSNNTNVGTTATVTITDKTGGNYTVSGTKTFTITAKPLTGARVEVTGTFTYTGNALTPAPTVTLDGKTLTENTDYTVAYDKNTDAGTATITVTGKGNYSGTAQGTFTIGRATLTVDGTGTASGTYGDKLSELTVSGLTAKLGEATVTGTWKLAGGTVPNVGDSGEYTATFTPATGVDNYNALEAQVTLNIAQATAPTPQTGTLNVQNGHAREYTYDLSRLLPVLASGQSFGGEVTYTLKTVNITEAGYYDIDTAAISGTTLTLPVKAVTSSDEGQIGTITVTISSKNFADVDATINVNRVNKQPVSIEGVTAQNGTYDGESHNGYTGTPTASPYSGGFTVTYAKADGTALSGAPTNAGDYTVTITLNENNDYTGSRTLSFTISKASITIKADDKRADAGTAKPALTYTVTGLASGDTLTTEPTLTCDADMNTIGQYPITASGAAVPSGGNYNTAITYVPGTLSVTDPTIPVTGVTLNKTSLGLTVGGSERLTATVAPSDATDKSVTWASSNTAVATVDSSGNVTAIGSGTATITVTTADGAKTAACTVTVRSNSGGGSSYVPSTPSDPSTSTITVPVSGDKDTVRVSASVSGTTATVSKIDTTQIENVIGDNGQASMVEIDFTGLGKTIDTVNLPAAAIKDIAAKAQNKEVGGLTVKLPEAEISFDANALSAIQAQAGSQITLTVTPAKPTDLNNRQKEAVGSAPVFDLTLRSSSGAITDFRGGYATVSLPYTLAAGQNPSGVVVYYLDNTGNITPCTTMYDVRSKSAIFTTGHLSLYFVGYDPAAVWVNPFSDVAEGAWYYDAVRFVSENGLMGGYGNGRFGPNDNLSRAQFAQILFNKEGRPVVNYLLQYGDVATGAWYTEAVRWATSQGIVGGYGNGMFGPNDNITREQLAVMLWRYAGSPAATDKELHFTDTDKASGFALEALRWAVENGVMGGYGDGRLDPKGLATRAQVAQMLKNYLEK